MLSVDTIQVQNENKKKEVLSSLDYPQRTARHEAIPEAHAQTFEWAVCEIRGRPHRYEAGTEDLGSTSVPNHRRREPLLLESGLSYPEVPARPVAVDITGAVEESTRSGAGGLRGAVEQVR